MKTITYDETKWKLVPIEPTTTMVIAGVNAALKNRDEPYFIFVAMLAAAPTPSAAGQEK